jgi:hypothetical protein
MGLRVIARKFNSLIALKNFIFAWELNPQQEFEIA